VWQHIELRKSDVTGAGWGDFLDAGTGLGSMKVGTNPTHTLPPPRARSLDVPLVHTAPPEMIHLVWEPILALYGTDPCCQRTRQASSEMTNTRKRCSQLSTVMRMPHAQFVMRLNTTRWVAVTASTSMGRKCEGAVKGKARQGTDNIVVREMSLDDVDARAVVWNAIGQYCLRRDLDEPRRLFRKHWLEPHEEQPGQFVVITRLGGGSLCFQGGGGRMLIHVLLG
jgi:hypothetical protein